MSPARHLPLWAISLLVVIGLHLGAYYLAMRWQPPQPAALLEPAAVLIELEPVVAPPPRPTPPQPQVEVEPEPEAIPEIEAPKPRLVVAKPKPRVEPRPRPEPPAPKADPQPESAPVEQQQAAAPVRAPAQQSNPGETDRERALWRARVQAYLSQRLHYPERERRLNRPGSKHDLVLNFTIDGRGRILASEVKQSSARASFGHDLQRQLRRASPVPPPPPGILSSGRISLDYPLSFTLD